MSTDAALLKLTHWMSPVFPVGGYAYSSGLETAIEDGAVADEASLSAWLERVLSVGSGRTDAILLTSAMEPDANHEELNHWAEALSGSAERWQEIDDQGRAFSRAVAEMGEGDGMAFSLPVAVGRAASGLGLKPEQVAAIYLQSVMSNLVTVAVRHVPIGQSAGARVIAQLQPIILAIAEEAPSRCPDDAFSSVPGSDLVQMRHETQDTRIFRT